MNRNRSLTALAVALTLIILNFHRLCAQCMPEGCANFSDSAWQAQAAAFKKRDTLRAVAIWASSGLNARGTKLPTFWRQIWDSNQLVSVPRFYVENSDSAGKRRYVLNVDPYGRLSDSTCFVGGDYVSGNCVGDSIFVRKVLDSADAVIDFRNYDRDGDKFVDALFFVINDTTAYSYYQTGSFFKGVANLCFSGTYLTKDSVGGCR